LLFEFAGQTAPFFASAAILFVGFVIALRIFFAKIRNSEKGANAA
jgi:hypothetical protein